MEKYGRNEQASYDSIMHRISFGRWVTNASDRHSEYVILIAFTQKIWFQVRASMLALFVHCLCLCLNGILCAVDKGAGSPLHTSR